MAVPVAELDRLLTQALNGWGAHARRKLEHDDIARIREERIALDRVWDRKPRSPRRQLGSLAARRRSRSEWLIAHRELGWESWLLPAAPGQIPLEPFRDLYRRMQIAGLFSVTSGLRDAMAWVRRSAEDAAAELAQRSRR